MTVDEFLDRWDGLFSRSAFRLQTLAFYERGEEAVHFDRWVKLGLIYPESVAAGDDVWILEYDPPDRLGPDFWLLDDAAPSTGRGGTACCSCTGRTPVGHMN